MPVLNIYRLDGSQAGTIEVNNDIFGIEPNKHVMHEVLVAELAEARQGSASTKTRTFIDFAKALNFDGVKQLYVTNDDTDTVDRDYFLYLSTRNIEKVAAINTRDLSIYWLIKQDKVILTKEALATIEEVLA